MFFSLLLFGDIAEFENEEELWSSIHWAGSGDCVAIELFSFSVKKTVKETNFLFFRDFIAQTSFFIVVEKIENVLT